MKRTSAVPALIILGLAGCDTMNQPVTSGAFDPLGPPGGEVASLSATEPVYAAGQFVRAIMDNAAFFKNRPKGDVDADKLLARGTSMKVIAASDSYLKVELDSGEIGWVPTIMVEDPNTAGPIETTTAPNPGEIQVYPPVPGSLPPVPATELPPEGAIPTVIDPDAPAPNPVPTPPVAPPATGSPAALPPSSDESGSGG